MKREKNLLHEGIHPENNIIYLRDRFKDMLKKDLIIKSPLRALAPETGNSSSRMGLIIARAGVGKTALLVQLAIDNMLRGNRVVHVSIGQHLEKTKTWYDDLFTNLARDCRLEKAGEVYGEIIRMRMIMTFNATTFSGPRLEERLNDLIYQNIFKPDCLVVDGFDFTGTRKEDLVELADIVKAMGLEAWFSAVRHKEGQLMNNSPVPAPCHEVDDLFNTIILLEPKAGGVALNIVKDTSGRPWSDQALLLDPSTFLIQGG